MCNECPKEWSANQMLTHHTSKLRETQQTGILYNGHHEGICSFKNCSGRTATKLYAQGIRFSLCQEHRDQYYSTEYEGTPNEEQMLRRAEFDDSLIVPDGTLTLRDLKFFSAMLKESIREAMTPPDTRTFESVMDSLFAAKGRRK